MLLQVGYDLEYGVRPGTSMIQLLRIHPSMRERIVGEETIMITGAGPERVYTDRFGNRCGRIVSAPDATAVRYQGAAVVEVDDEPDPVVADAAEHDIADLPDETLTFLLPSRYCEVDGELMQLAWDRFGGVAPGWGRVQAVCDFVHEWLTFDYQQARSTRTALDAYHERVGVCRDFTHLFVTLCRCLNISARYVAGYLGDIGVPPDPAPMDFSAWARVFLGGQWHTFDPRHNERRIGRVLMAEGRDATDIAVVTVFGPQWLHRFDVVTEEHSPS